jgi:tetratricopeptide (TPR) repeat protein
MSGFPTIRSLTALLAACWFLTDIACAQAVSRMSTRFIARGEQALLEIAVTDTQPTDFPRIPTVEGVEITLAGRAPKTQLQPGRRLEYVFEYLVSSYAVGNHTLPSFEVVAGGMKLTTEPISFVVFNPDELKWSEATSGRVSFRYASAFRVLNPTPYEGETTPVEIKLFVPRDLFVQDWGIPDFQREGLTSWRFQPSMMRGEVNLLGMPYISVAYPSTLTPTRTGKVGIGPATIRLITTQVVMDGFLQRVSQEVNVAVPKLELDCQPLPPGAPEGFENAVGNFKLAVSTQVTDVQEGDPIPVDITVTGSGNLDTLRAPSPVDSTGWKLYEPTTDARGEERRELSGSTTFHQFMRPLELKPAVPAFRLVYFDPKEKAYKTLTSEPIVLKMKPSSAAAAAAASALAPPQSLATPVERMTDILGILSPASLTIDDRGGFPKWIGHAIGALLAALLIAKALWMRYGHRFHQDPARQKRLAALREVEAIRGDDTGFLMSAGSYIERWLGTHNDPELRGIIEERDALCFRGENGPKTTLPPDRRNAILRSLRKAAMLLTFSLFMAGGASRVRAEDAAAMARQAYDAARFDEAVAHWLKAGPYESLSADTLYNIGNACYRAGSPGHAALYYRRALSRDPGHAESRQNLRFIERKYGSITVHRPDYQYALAKIPLASWQNLLWVGAWICVLAVLVFPATRPGARVRLLAVCLLVVGPMLAAGGALGWRYFPNDSEFASPDKQAVIVEPDAVLHADAARTSPEVIDAPPGSICEIIRQSGRWAYVAFATKTRGWIPMENIETIIPSTPPEAPKIRKPKADGKSA